MIYLSKMMIFMNIYHPTNSPPPWRRLQDPACRLRFLRHEQTTGLMAAKLTGGREASNKPNGAKGWPPYDLNHFKLVGGLEHEFYFSIHWE